MDKSIQEEMQYEAELASHDFMTHVALMRRCYQFYLAGRIDREIMPLNWHLIDRLAYDIGAFDVRAGLPVKSIRIVRVEVLTALDLQQVTQ